MSKSQSTKAAPRAGAKKRVNVRLVDLIAERVAKNVGASIEAVRSSLGVTIVEEFAVFEDETEDCEAYQVQVRITRQEEDFIHPVLK